MKQKSILPRFPLFLITLSIGIILIILSALSGEGSFGLILFIPYFQGSGLLSLLGILCIMLSFFILFFGIASRAVDSDEYYKSREIADDFLEGEKESEFGGVIFIGPIPIVFGSNKKITLWMIVVAFVVAVIIFASVLLYFLK